MSAARAPGRGAQASRERLEGLMLFRVVLVTLFLGTALLFDVEALADLGNLRNATYLTLIVGTYLLTIFYALLLRAQANPAEMVVTQLVCDLAVTLVLVDVSGGLESPFLFLFPLNIINAAIVVGRRGAVYMAAAAFGSLMLLGGLAVDAFGPQAAPGPMWKATVFRVGINGVAGFTVALLAGYLTERLGEATSQLAEQQVSLRELRALNENILESLSSGLVTVDSEGVVIFFNRAAAEITGRAADEILERPFDEALPALAGTMKGSRDGRRETVIVRPDGSEVSVGFSISTLQTAEGEDGGQIVIFQDLSDIRKLEDRMRRSERLAAVGQLSAAIAHEIRNPLASISGSVEMLSTAEDASKEDTALMQIILREVDRLNGLISEFLDYTRPRPLHREEANVCELVDDVLGLFENRHGDVTTEVSHGDRDALAAIDREAIRQVLWNLLNNAAEAAAAAPQPTIIVETNARPEHVRIVVEDNGPGVDDELQEKIFQPFFTTKTHGTGLGLATIFRIVEDHDGVISLEAPQKLGGARFEVLLPLTDAKVRT